MDDRVPIRTLARERAADVRRAALPIAQSSLAAGIAWLVARRLQQLTGGHGPEELARLFATHEAAVHSVEDGLVLLRDGVIEFCTDRAERMLGLTKPVPLALADPGVTTQARLLLESTNDAGVIGRHSVIVERTEASVLHLDLASVEHLAQALAAYRGALIVASHDQPVLDRIGIDTWWHR